MPHNKVPAYALSQEDEEFLVSLNDKRLGSAIRASALEGQSYSEARVKRKSLADALKHAGIDAQGNYTPDQRKRLLEIADKIETAIPGKPTYQPGIAAQKRADKRTQEERLHQAGERAETQLVFSQAREGKPSYVSPEDRAKFHRLFVNPPPKEAPKEAPKKPEGPTPSQQVAAALGRRARVRQIERASQPAPRRSVKRPKLHVKKSGVPKLTKGKNVKLQVPSGKLPHTQQMRSVLKRGGSR